MANAEQLGIQAGAYIPLLQKMARYHHLNLVFAGVRNIEEGELVSEGFFGLNKALKSFDSEKSPNFERYAFWMIRFGIQGYLRSKNYLPREKQGGLKRMKAVKTRLEQKLGRKCSDGELAEAMGFTLEQLHALQRQEVSEVSLSQELEGEEGTIQLSDKLATGEDDLDTSVVIAAALEHCLHTALDPVERRVLLLIYLQGYSGPEVMKMIDRGANLQRIHYLHRRGLAKLQNCLQK